VINSVENAEQRQPATNQSWGQLLYQSDVTGFPIDIPNLRNQAHCKINTSCLLKSPNRSPVLRSKTQKQLAEANAMTQASQLEVSLQLKGRVNQV